MLCSGTHHDGCRSGPLRPGPALPTALTPERSTTAAAAPETLRRPVGKRIRRSFIPDFKLPPVQNGLAPVLTKIETKHPVVFLTIDDGITRTPKWWTS